MLSRSTFSENSHQVSTPTISGSKKTKAEASANTRLKPTPAPTMWPEALPIMMDMGLKPPIP